MRQMAHLENGLQSIGRQRVWQCEHGSIQYQHIDMADLAPDSLCRPLHRLHRCQVQRHERAPFAGRSPLGAYLRDGFVGFGLRPTSQQHTAPEVGQRPSRLEADARISARHNRNLAAQVPAVQHLECRRARIEPLANVAQAARRIFASERQPWIDVGLSLSFAVDEDGLASSFFGLMPLKGDFLLAYRQFLCNKQEVSRKYLFFPSKRQVAGQTFSFTSSRVCRLRSALLFALNRMK